MQTQSLVTRGQLGTASDKSTKGTGAGTDGDNLPAEPGSGKPHRLMTRGLLETQGGTVQTSGRIEQGRTPEGTFPEGYEPPRKVWSDVDTGFIEAVLRSLRRDQLGFESYHDSIQFIDDQGGTLGRLARPDGDRFKELMDNESFRGILQKDPERAFELAAKRFPSFDEETDE